MEILDREFLLGNLEGDRDMLAEIVGIFRSSVPDTLGDIRRAVSGGDAPGIQRGAHQLKGALANLGARAASAAAAQLEGCGRGAALGEAAGALEALEEELRRLEPELDALLGRS